MKSNTQNYFEEFKVRFSTYTDRQIISAFNKEVGSKGWGTARASFLSAIHTEFERREINYSEIGDEKSLSFQNFICLEGKKVIVVNEKSIQ